MTSPLLRAAFTACLLTACGGGPADACADYLRTTNDCAVQALGLGESAQTDDEVDEFCSAYDNLKGGEADAATQRFECASAAFDGADCGSSESYQEAAAEAQACLYE